MHDHVTLHVDAPPSAVWPIVSDPTRVGEFSPETLGAEWIDADGPRVGARFRGHVKRNGRGPMYWTECVVDVCDPEREFTFTVLFRGRRINTWSYVLDPRDGGTDLTESFRLEDTPFLRGYWAAFGRWRRQTNLENMRQTLERMRAVAERR